MSKKELTRWGVAAALLAVLLGYAENRFGGLQSEMRAELRIVRSEIASVKQHLSQLEGRVGRIEGILEVTARNQPSGTTAQNDN